MMHGHEKSDPAIVAVKPTNKAKEARCGGICGGGRSGVGGAKGGGQGECAPTKHAPDSEPGKRDTGAGAYTATCAVTHPRWEPYAGKPHVRIWAGGARKRASLPRRRREFITLLGGAAAAWPLAARAQQPAMPVVGFLTSLGRNDRPNLVDAFRRGLSEAGYVEGRNVAIEYRFAENQHDRLPALAADLVGRKVAVIAATGGGNSVLAAKAATTTIPIVFMTAATRSRGLRRQPQPAGRQRHGGQLVRCLARGKALGLLHELVPNAAVIALLANPKTSGSRAHAKRRAGGRARARPAIACSQCQHPERDRRRLRHAAATARRRASCRRRSVLYQPPPADCCAGGARCHPGHVRQPRICRRGRADELWQRRCRRVSPGRHSTSGGFSRARSPPTCRSIRPPSSSS